MTPWPKYAECPRCGCMAREGVEHLPRQCAQWAIDRAQALVGVGRHSPAEWGRHASAPRTQAKEAA